MRVTFRDGLIAEVLEYYGEAAHRDLLRARGSSREPGRRCFDSPATREPGHILTRTEETGGSDMCSETRARAVHPHHRQVYGRRQAEARARPVAR